MSGGLVKVPAVVSASQPGLVPKLPNDATKFLNGVGGYSTPSGSGASGNIILCHRNVSVGAPFYISVGSNSAFNIGSPSKFTVRMWIMPGSTNTNNGLATRSSLSSSQGDWALGFFNGSSQRLTLRLNNNAASLQSATDLANGVPYFVEASYDSSLGSNNMKIFVNGNLDCQGNYSTVITNNAVAIKVGTYFDNAHGFLGFISDFEFCAGVVRNTASYTPPTLITPDANTTIHWLMNEYTASAVTDDSGNGFNGVGVGAPSVPYIEPGIRKL